MKLKTFITLFALIISSSVGAQKYMDFEFEKNPEYLSSITLAQKNLDEAVLKRVNSKQFYFDGDDFVQYVFNQTVTWVNSDDAIEGNNKIYISTGENSEYEYQIARVIKPNGEIKVLKEEDIKEGVDEDTETKYNYFALEGLEEGSIVEYASYRKSTASYQGSFVSLQGTDNWYNVTFELISPPNLIFTFKSLNNAPEVQADSALLEDDEATTNRWFIKLDSTPGIKSQPYLYREAVKQSVVYKLDRNTYNNSKDITSYGPIAENVYNNVIPELPKKIKKKLGKILKEIGTGDITSEEEKIRAIENYVKEKYTLVDNSYAPLKELEFVLDNKAGNDVGFMRLTCMLLKMEDIDFQIVLTSDRSDIRFDPEFEAYIYLQEYALYLPNQDLYMAPTRRSLRLGYLPPLWTHNYGLFIYTVSVGEFSSAIGKIKFIDPLGPEKTVSNMDINVDFSTSPAKPNIRFKQSISGYAAQYFQPTLYLYDDEELEDLKNGLVESIHEQMEADDIELENIGPHDFGVNPFVMKFETDNHPFIEKAGNNLLFKVGELIGPQMEMYQEEERHHDVENDHTRMYDRTISFTIPDGYEIKNLDDLNLNFSFGGDNPNLYFVSNYTQEGNTVTVKCKEYYTEIMYPLAEFENYKSVINAAADFNKIVLVMKKK